MHRHDLMISQLLTFTVCLEPAVLHSRRCLRTLGVYPETGSMKVHFSNCFCLQKIDTLLIDAFHHIINTSCKNICLQHPNPSFAFVSHLSLSIHPIGPISGSCDNDTDQVITSTDLKPSLSRASRGLLISRTPQSSNLPTHFYVLALLWNLNHRLQFVFTPRRLDAGPLLDQVSFLVMQSHGARCREPRQQRRSDSQFERMQNGPRCRRRAHMLLFTSSFIIWTRANPDVILPFEDEKKTNKTLGCYVFLARLQPVRNRRQEL